MGESVAETLSEIEATRAKLEHDLNELLDRLPEPAVMARRAKAFGVVAVGTAALAGVGAVQVRNRSKDAARRKQARVNAEELARAFSPNPPAPTDSSVSKAGALALVVAVAALVFTAVQTVRRRGAK